MGSIRISFSDRVESLLRNHLPARKGAISKFVEEAVIEKLEKEGVIIK